MINNKETYHYKLQDIIEMFYGKDGKLLKFKVDRNGIPLDFELRLEDVLKKKTFN